MQVSVHTINKYQSALRFPVVIQDWGTSWCWAVDQLLSLVHSTACCVRFSLVRCAFLISLFCRKNVCIVREDCFVISSKNKTHAQTTERAIGKTTSIQPATQPEMMFERTACIFFLPLFLTYTRNHGVLSRIVRK